MAVVLCRMRNATSVLLVSGNMALRVVRIGWDLASCGLGHRDYKGIEWALHEKSRDKMKLPNGAISDWLNSRCPNVNSHSQM
jgi:hypothetical protein